MIFSGQARVCAVILLLVFEDDVNGQSVLPVINATELSATPIISTTQSSPSSVVTVTQSPSVKTPVRITPAPDPNKREILICMLIEKSNGDRSVVYDYDRVAAAIDIAMDYVNEKVIQNGYKLVKYHKDIGKDCSRKNLVVKKALELRDKGVNCDFYLGPGCGASTDSLYNFAEYMQTPMIACPGFGFGTAAARSTYFMATRISYTSGGTANFILKFLDLYSYKHITIITDDTIDFYQLLSPVLISRATARTDLTVKTINIDHSQATDENKQAFLRDGSSVSRVFVLLAKAAVVRHLLVLAHRMNMTGGDHVFVGVELYESESWGRFTWSAGDSEDREAKLAFQSLILVSFNQIKSDYYDTFSGKVRKLARKRYNYTFGAFEEMDPVITNFYDSILLYAGIINQAIGANASVFDGPSMSKRTRNFSFISPVNGLVKMDAAGDRIGEFTLKSMNPESGRFEVFYTYSGITNQLMSIGQPFWLTGTAPPDVPHCGFLGDNPICFPLLDGLSGTMIAIIAAVVAVVALTVIGVTVYLIIRSVRHEGVDPNWWKINSTDLEVTTSKTKSKSQLSLGSKIGSIAADETTSKSTKGDGVSSGSLSGRTATWKGNLVSVQDVTERQQRFSSALIKELNQVRVLNHQCLQRVLGVSLDHDGLCCFVVGELCQKGSLMDLLEKDSLKLDWSFKNSLIKDTVMGMAYLHASTVESHGNLTAYSCLIDSRFLLKVSDYGITIFRDRKELMPPFEDQNERNFDMLLWRAPELMRQIMPIKGTQKGDVYSFGIILQQIILRSHPFDSSGDPARAHLTAKDFVLEVKKGLQPPMRPHVPTSACSSELYELMERCWDEYPIERPTFAKIKDRLKKVIGSSADNIIDHLLKRMEQYAHDLEAQVSEKTRQFAEEKKRSEELLSQLLPKSVAQALTKGLTVDPESYDNVSIYFSDIVGFTIISAAGTPMDVVSMLNNLYTLFDSVLAKFDAYKVETIGDAYTVASGLPVKNGNRHASEIAYVSLNIRKELDSFVIPHQPSNKLRLRIGNNSGPCVAGIVGLKMPRYCLFGDSVQLAMKMESSGEPQKIQITRATKDLLDEVGGFVTQERDQPVVFKDKEIKTYWLISGK